jgi:hypothetical protein
LTSSLIKVTTDAAGNVPFQINGACKGGGSLRGLALIYFFS